MEKVIFEDEYKSLFNQNGLNTVDDFFEFKGGKIINQNSHRNVTVFDFDHNGQKERFFMKRFFTPHFKDMLAAFLNFRKICSQAEVEWSNAKKLIDIGIPTYQPVCYGVDMAGPIEKRSLFITKELAGSCMTDYVAENWKNFDETQKKTLLTEMAHVAVKAHNAGLSLPDLYIWHYWVMKDAPNYELGKIDLHMTKHRAPASQQMKDLGALHHSMIDDYFTNDEKEFLLDEYFKISGRNKDKLYKKIIARSEKISGRRRKPVY